jgi:hypothetical protein
MRRFDGYIVRSGGARVVSFLYTAMASKSCFDEFFVLKS